MRAWHVTPEVRSVEADLSRWTVDGRVASRPTMTRMRLTVVRLIASHEINISAFRHGGHQGNGANVCRGAVVCRATRKHGSVTRHESVIAISGVGLDGDELMSSCEDHRIVSILSEIKLGERHQFADAVRQVAWSNEGNCSH